MNTINNANNANAVANNAIAADPSIVKIGDRKKLQGTRHKYIVNELGEYTCNYCEKTSKNQSTISEHISRLHASDAGRIVKPFDCPNCEKRFNSASIRDQHIQNNHFNIRDNCVMPGCNYKGKSGSALCGHYARKHMDIDSLITVIDCDILACNHCDKHLNKPAILYHLARCSPTSPYCKDIQDSMRATSNLGLEEEDILSELEAPKRKSVITDLPVFKSKPYLKPYVPVVDLSNAKPADKICSPSDSEKPKKARKERTVKKPRKRLIIILEEMDD